MVLNGVVILAGGHSKRMGSPKAQLTLPTGELLLDYHVRQAGKLDVPIMIADNGHGFSVDKKRIDNVHVFHIADYVSTSDGDDKRSTDNNKNNDTGGALVAIESALQYLLDLDNFKRSQDKLDSWLLVISCDSLIGASDLWQHLSAATSQNYNNKLVICLNDNNHLYPLLGLYRLSIEPELKNYIDSGQRRVMRFVEPISRAVAITPQWRNLTNFNTPIEFERACAFLYS